MATTTVKVREFVNLGAAAGTVAPGDRVICGSGEYHTVTVVVIHPAGQRPDGAPIRADLTVVEVRTTGGGQRWLGADDAHIGSDLRVHWSRARAG